MQRKMKTVMSVLCCLILSLPSGALTAERMVSCTFNGFVVEYPEHLKLQEHEMGLFFLDDDGFIQINSQVFPESFSTPPVSEWLEKGVVDYLKQASSEEFTYTSDGELLHIGDLEFIYLEARKGDIPFYQYFARIDHVLILFTVKGDVCNSFMPDVLKSLRKANSADLEGKRYTTDTNDTRITRKNEDGSEELAGFRTRPTPVTYASFMKGYLEFMLTATGVESPDDFPISRCYFSDGRYVRVFGDRGMITRFYTAGPLETDSLTGVYFTVDPSSVSEGLMISASTACLFASYNGFGEMHQETVNRFGNLMTSGFPETGGDEAFWTENGFEVFLGKTQSVNYVKIQWLGDTEEQLLPVPDILSDSLQPLDRPELTANRYIEKHNLMCQMLTGNTGLEITPQSEITEEDGLCVLTCTAAGILKIKLYRRENDSSSPVILVRLECDYNAPGLLEVECLAALYAASEITVEEMIDVISIGDDTMNLWESICHMKPYVNVDGVVLQAAQDGERMLAVLYGDDR